MIYLTYFANLRHLPPDVKPVSICAKPPAGWSGPSYKKLAPKYSDLMEYKDTGDWDSFSIRYFMHNLAPNNPSFIVQDIHRLVGSGDIALVCYEKTGNHCHRELVGEWLRDHGYIVKEFIPKVS